MKTDKDDDIEAPDFSGIWQKMTPEQRRGVAEYYAELERQAAPDPDPAPIEPVREPVWFCFADDEDDPHAPRWIGFRAGDWNGFAVMEFPENVADSLKKAMGAEDGEARNLAYFFEPLDRWGETLWRSNGLALSAGASAYSPISLAASVLKAVAESPLLCGAGSLDELHTLCDPNTLGLLQEAFWGLGDNAEAMARVNAALGIVGAALEAAAKGRAGQP